ncbi:MAG: Peptidylprolyl isomerase [Frankiales bacterium]|nr:Peptidylprolyl isomerase [Frankiales bacterium]
MTRTPRWAAAAVLALALSACGGGGDDPTLGSSSAAPTAATTAVTCTLKPVTIPAPASVSKDLSTKPAVPVNTGPVPTQVQVADVVVGTGAVAGEGAAVEVKYVGAGDKTGKEFDSSWKGGPDSTLPFRICGTEQEGDLIPVVPGFSVSPLGMKVGGRRLVRIPSAQGYPDGIPEAGVQPGDAITFVIDLVKVR